jgi:hypothetical protein
VVSVVPVSLVFLELLGFRDLAALVVVLVLVVALALVAPEFLVLVEFQGLVEYLVLVAPEFLASVVFLVKDCPALAELQGSLDLVEFQALAGFLDLAEPAVFLVLVALVLLALADFLVLAHLDSQDLVEPLDFPALVEFLATVALVFRGSQGHRASLALVV